MLFAIIILFVLFIVSIFIIIYLFKKYIKCFSLCKDYNDNNQKLLELLDDFEQKLISCEISRMILQL